MSTHSARFRVGVATLLVASLSPLACSDATDVELLEIGGQGALAGLAFIDLDGSGGQTPADTPMVSVEVLLLTSTGEVVREEMTDSIGTFLFDDVPVGSYRLSAATSVLGDSLSVLSESQVASVALGDTAQLDLGTTFAVLSLPEVLAAPVGRRVITSGIALNARVNFGDGQVHFAADSTFLRGLQVERSSLAAGDSVRLTGRVVMDNGRPALEEVTPFVLVTSAALVLPRSVTVGEARTADGGRLDAALVQIRDAEITDTSSVGDDFRFWATSGPDSVEVIVRGFLGLNTEAFRPDTIVRLDRLTGLLSPREDGPGGVRWQVLPRSGGDVVFETRSADVGVSLALDTAEAALGDTVTMTVVASNAGPLSATAWEVRDTIPSGLSFVSSSTTVGSYDDATGVWTIGDLAPGAMDTLRVMMEVVAPAPTTLTLIAESLGLTLEVDPNGANNQAARSLTIS